MSIMQVDVVSNEESIYSGEASFAVVPTLNGELGIYPRHEPIMSLVRPGVLRLQVPEQEEEVLVAVSGGILEVQPHKIMILADVAVRSAGSTDENKARSHRALFFLLVMASQIGFYTRWQEHSQVNQRCSES